MEARVEAQPRYGLYGEDFAADRREGWAAAVCPLPNAAEPPGMTDALCQRSRMQVLTGTESRSSRHSVLRWGNGRRPVSTIITCFL